MIKQQKKITQNRRGRPATGAGILIGVRLQPIELAELDTWRNRAAGEPSRPEAMRTLLKLGLKVRKAPKE